MNTRQFNPALGLGRRGSTIFTALVMVGLMSMSVLAMLQYSIYQQRMTQRRIEREAVYYVAEPLTDD